MTDRNKTNADQNKERKYPILFHGNPWPKGWSGEKAAAQLAKMPGKVYSGRELAEMVGLITPKMPRPEE